ncbi:MAG: nuclear transport factor 2 family protein [Bacteroidetes bacterium]|uniref:nuclear transport factor 2 family protein n=1 Tax=Phnomibacter sp. TaxID=2836217 RepID=UPI002FDD3BE9|nr:nuclear transport factor 2 family protein [Bacteroidota bacterium]
MKHWNLATTVIIVASLSWHAGLAQTTAEEKAVAGVINNMFDAMRQADSAGIMQAFASNAHIETITKTKQQTDTVRGNTVAQFASSITKQKAGALDERISIGAIHIDGNMATVWTPYQFYFNGQISHCGVNSFQLVKLNGEWKIQYIIDTRRKDNCL